MLLFEKKKKKRDESQVETNFNHNLKWSDYLCLFFKIVVAVLDFLFCFVVLVINNEIRIFTYTFHVVTRGFLQIF